MKFKQSLLLTLSLSMVLLSANSHAGRQGINILYGVGIGAAAPKSSDSDEDPVATASAFFGFTEDGWSIEAMAFQSSEGGNGDLFDYSFNGRDIGIAYRSVEENNQYYKFKISETESDYESTEKATNISTTFEDISGRSYTVGIGWRTSRETRVELDYTYNSVDDSSVGDVVHLITLSYVWGGAPYLGKSF